MDSLSAGLVYPFNVTPVGNSVDNSQVANDFARAFADAQYIASRRFRRSWLWELFELFGDNTVEPMKVVNAYIEPILKDAIERANIAATQGKKPFSEFSGEDTLLDHLVRITTGRSITGYIPVGFITLSRPRGSQG